MQCNVTTKLEWDCVCLLNEVKDYANVTLTWGNDIGEMKKAIEYPKRSIRSIYLLVQGARTIMKGFVAMSVKKINL